MAKTLPDGRIQVEPGDQLQAIYGSNWKALSGYTGDPTKLQVGTILPAKPAGSLGGSLNTGVTEEKTLPSTSLDKLGMFREVLRTITATAAQEAKASGAKALPEGMLKPEQVSGNTFAGILNLVSQEKTRGIKDIYTSTVDMIENSKKQAQTQLNTLISTGAIKDLDDKMLTELSTLTDYPVEYLKTIRSAAKTNTSKLTDLDRINQINTFLSSKVGDDGKIAAKTYIEAYKKWIGLGGSVQDFKYSFPVEEWLGSWEYKNLPGGWQPSASSVTDVKNLPEDQQVFINQVQSKINSGELTYDDAVDKYPKIAVYLKPL